MLQDLQMHETTEAKARVLIVGSGAVGIMAAYALETGGKAEVTAVMRSNYQAVLHNGISIDSLQHGHGITGFRPTESMFPEPQFRQTVPDVAKEGLRPYDFILVTTKNIPDVPPKVEDLVAPAVTSNETAIVLSQNGLNIEKGLTSRLPYNPIISSVSTIGATEVSLGCVKHDDHDIQKIGPFTNSRVDAEVAAAAAQRYCRIYNGAGKLQIMYEPDVDKTRWRKLVYNASFNTVATVLRMDTARIRMTRHVVDELIKPIMFEIIAAANANGVDLDPSLVVSVVRADPVDAFFHPSMMQDIEKGNYIEAEVIAGEPLRAGEALGVPMPTLKVMYGLLKGLQTQTKERRGQWKAEFLPDNPYGTE